MKRIGILSDTHSFLHPRCFEFFSGVDEVWHAGDIGNKEVVEQLAKFKPLRAVYGNIDGHELRAAYPMDNLFMCEGVKVLITHIGGYPGRYEKRIPSLLLREKPGLFVTGHSHILKVMYDKKYKHLFINPGAAGKYGFHLSITMVRFSVDGVNMKDMDVLDIPKVQQ
jgi:putative phosphoesterase